MDAVMRYNIADFLDVGTSTEEYALMGTGFNSLNESPNAQKDSKTYIHEKSQTSSIKGYQVAFPFDTDLVADDRAVMALYDVGRNQLTGKDAEKNYVRVELFRPVESQENTFEARKFTVAVEVSSFDGEGGGIMKATGTLNGVGDFIDGTFNTTTKKFTPKQA